MQKYKNVEKGTVPFSTFLLDLAEIWWGGIGAAKFAEKGGKYEKNSKFSGVGALFGGGTV
jgi:hypothetical protein